MGDSFRKTGGASRKHGVFISNWLEIARVGESYMSGNLMRAGEAGADRQIQEMAIG